MKIEKNKLVKVNWKSEEFKNKLYIKNVNGLVFDTIKVFGWMDTNKEDKNMCPFFITRFANDISTVIPMFSYDKYIMTAEILKNANVIEIKSEDYMKHFATMGGDYEFVLNDEVEIK